MTGPGSSCGACKFLRRKCTRECVFAPYFCYDQAASHFGKVHRVFGASNVSKLLLHLPVHRRGDAATTIAYEALARMHDPIYGCVSHIYALQQQVACLQQEIDILNNQMANHAFYALNIGPFGATNNLSVGLQSNLQTTDINMGNRLNQGQMLFNGEVTSDNQEFYSQINITVPTSYECEEQLYNVSFDIDLPELPFEGINQEMFVPYLWTGSSHNSSQRE
ncbi:LOB domain-containing protein [Heracleum sosnowskyi]|uniref:LOB domain-containing protein n=1 Tax=Heracleum sosnowskyi TaxID=360622 RepID=A0AAD8MMC5_9APIA|nr:LOB domain-containing protein [Heracleum sosnowskyi]